MDEKQNISTRKPGSESVGGTQHTPAQTPRKRRRGEGGTDVVVRFFTADKTSQDGPLVLSKEHDTEAKAIIAAFESKQPFYRVETFTTAPKVQDGAVVIDKVPSK